MWDQLQLLKILNAAPALDDLHKAQHVLHAHPFIPDTLVMLGLAELEDWSEVNRQLNLAARIKARPCKRGQVANMLSNLQSNLSEHSNGSNINFATVKRKSKQSLL